MSDDTEIEELDYLCGLRVVDIGDIRVARGKTRRPIETCNHNSVVFDAIERRIWCKDCEKEVTPFDAFENIVKQFDGAYRRINSMKAEAMEAKKHSLHLIACKKLEKIWRGRKMTPACPHCNEAILPEDMADISHCVSLEIARQKRKTMTNNHNATLLEGGE